MNEILLQNQNKEAFQKYLNEGFDHIEGWPGRKESVFFLQIFRELFDSLNQRGGACEIGVHHGKYLIALHNILAPCKSLGLDLFAQQHRNIDGSGRGSREICEQNILKYAVDPDLISLVNIDSLGMTQRELKEIEERFGPFHFFSIDGGHTALHACSDFFTASALTSKDGIIIVDDIFHPDWPGVTEGIYLALARKSSPFVPLFLTRKKLFLCHISVRHTYTMFILEKKADIPYKMIDFFSYLIPSLNFGGEY